MFDTLDRQMRHDDSLETTSTQRMVKWALIAFASVLLFGGLYSAIQLLP
jgi:lipid-A-disaccharide synthase-like uncharacterized protein